MLNKCQLQELVSSQHPTISVNHTICSASIHHEKVYPTPITLVGVSLHKSSAASKSPVVFTIWKKSLLFNCDGFTVFNCNGNLVFRVDNYVPGGNGEIVLMDASGCPLLTIRRKFSVMKHLNVFSTKSLAYVSKSGSSKNENTRIPMYQISGSYAERCCFIYDDTRWCVADIRSKEAEGGVALGGDVFRLVVQPLFDPVVAMALVSVLDQMFGSSRRSF
ncbi:hypothetical protein OSB04_020134 [Centaurea solstitialis]|uniref:Uncharacterized protein n=1 Tax=Centaurea solstitialis TaxID=347529 RepID=A0AA38T522_9ASTR|nr:hypothetical protein OSB04_020134 [Centaurea solstitialis]